MLSLIGNWVEAAAFGYVVLLLGGSAATLGLIGFLNTIPNLVLGLPAGALADRYDRKKLLLLFQGLNMGVAVLLAVLWATDALTVPLMGAIAVVGGSLGTLSFPAFQGMLASTVPARDLESAVAVNSLSLQLARFIGPAIAGVLLAWGGPQWVFAFNAATFLAVLGTVAVLPGSRAAAANAAARVGGAISEGLRYVFGQRSIASLIMLTLLAGLFGTPPIAFMIPALVRLQLHGGAETLGALTAAIGLGSLLGSIALLRLAGRPNKGEPVLGASSSPLSRSPPWGSPSRCRCRSRSRSSAASPGFCSWGSPPWWFRRPPPRRCGPGPWRSGQRPSWGCSRSAR